MGERLVRAVKRIYAKKQSHQHDAIFLTISATISSNVSDITTIHKIMRGVGHNLYPNTVLRTWFLNEFGKKCP